MELFKQIRLKKIRTLSNKFILEWNSITISIDTSISISKMIKIWKDIYIMMCTQLTYKKCGEKFKY